MTLSLLNCRYKTSHKYHYLMSNGSKFCSFLQLWSAVTGNIRLRLLLLKMICPFANVKLFIVILFYLLLFLSFTVLKITPQGAFAVEIKFFYIVLYFFLIL